MALPARATAMDCPPVVTVGVSDLGYAAYVDHGVYRGVEIDLVAELGKRTGCRFRIDWFPHGRLFVQLAGASIDMALAGVRTRERDQFASWVPFAYTHSVLLLNDRSKNSYRSLEEFVDRGTERLNITRGNVYAPAVAAQLARLEKQGRLEYVASYDLVFKKMQAGRADGTLSTPVIYLMYLRRLGMEDRVRAMPLAELSRSVTGAYLSNANLNSAARRCIADAIAAMLADGTVQHIYARYLGEDKTRELFAGGVREIQDASPTDPATLTPQSK